MLVTPQEDYNKKDAPKDYVGGFSYVEIDNFNVNDLKVFFIPSYILNGLGEEITSSSILQFGFSEDKLSKFFTKNDIKIIKDVSKVLTSEGGVLRSYGLGKDGGHSIENTLENVRNIINGISYETTVFEAASSLNDNAIILWESFNDNIKNDVEELIQVRNSQRILYSLSKFCKPKTLVATKAFQCLLKHKEENNETTNNPVNEKR